MIDTKRTTIEIATDTLIEIKAMAVKQGTTQNNIITDLINKGLKVTKNKQGKIKSRVINHEMLGYDPEKKVSLEEVVGIIKLDHETDAVELKNSIYTDKARF